MKQNLNKIKLVYWKKKRKNVPNASLQHWLLINLSTSGFDELALAKQGEFIHKLCDHYGKIRWDPLGNNLVVFANAQPQRIQIFLSHGRWVATLQEVDQNK